MDALGETPFALTVAAPAKLNLGLEVLRRRADGYHELATIFLTVSLFDEISVASAPGTTIGLDCSGSDISPQENLVWQAAEAMQQVAPGRGALLQVEKRIPIAAGLGGASSDAAATLLALRELWQAPVCDEALAAMALELGSDVPFLLHGGCALGTGRGEVLEALPSPGALNSSHASSPEEPSPPASLPVSGRGETNVEEAEALVETTDQSADSVPNPDTQSGVKSPSPAQVLRERGWDEGRSDTQTNGHDLLFLIVAPRVQIPRKTASLFAALAARDFSDGERVQEQAARLRRGLPLEPALLGNAFSRALYALRPDVAAVADAMRDAGATHVALSGAGPAHYALFNDPALAHLVKRRLDERLGERAATFLAVPVPARPLGAQSGAMGQP